MLSKLEMRYSFIHTTLAKIYTKFMMLYSLKNNKSSSCDTVSFLSFI